MVFTVSSLKQALLVAGIVIDCHARAVETYPLCGQVVGLDPGADQVAIELGLYLGGREHRQHIGQAIIGTIGIA